MFSAGGGGTSRAQSSLAVKVRQCLQMLKSVSQQRYRSLLEDGCVLGGSDRHLCAKPQWGWELRFH